ncbi:MAG: tRNA CCA-pyrophosphorylase [Candidatus Thorarchaeota archaeon]|nr:MAG: tRNA CCA-pyrophosphorylase [Candidatus Thorarchaeota archaeon]
MNSGSVKVLVTSGRTLSQGRAMEKGKMTSDYEDAVAVCELDATAMEFLGIENGESIVVKTEIGKITVKAKLNKNLHPGIAFIPCGPYFNFLLDSYTQHTGMPGFKSLQASIAAAPGESISSVKEITRILKEDT